MRVTSGSRVLSILLLLLFVFGVLLMASEEASAQVPPALIGGTTWRGTLTQTPPAPGFGSGVWNITEFRVTNASGGSSVTGFAQSQSNPQYWISYTEGGTISSGTYTYTGSSHGANLPFGDSPCSVGGTLSISATSITASSTGGGTGSCGTTSATEQLWNVSGENLGDGPPGCPVCGNQSLLNPPNSNVPINSEPGPIAPLNPSGPSGSVPGNFDQMSRGGIGKVGASMDLMSGNVAYPVTDYTTAGPNRLKMKRYYNSQSPYMTLAASTGPNWRTEYDRYLNIGPTYLTGFGPGTGNLIVERPDGSQMIFYSSGGTYTTDSYYDAKMTSSGSTYTLTLHDDTVETYTVTGSTGKLTSITYRGGYSQTMAYNGSGQLSTVTDTYGRQLTFTYTGTNLTQVTTPDSLVLTYAYNTGGMLASVSYNTSPVTSQIYNYANATFPSALTSVTDENGNTFQGWTYDNYLHATASQTGGPLAVEVSSVAYNDSTDGTRTFTNTLGQQAKYNFLYFSSAPRPALITRTSGTASSYQETYDLTGFLSSTEDWSGNITAYTNDSHGDPTTIVEGSGTASARTTTITYDTTCVHLPATVVTPGLTTTYTYDANCNPLTITGTDTTTTSIPYSTNGQTRTWTMTWSNFLPQTIKSPNGNITTYTWDATGALTNVQNALSQNTQITSHTGGGLPLTIVDPNSVTTTLTYNPRNWLLTSTMSTSGSPLTTTATYDSAGDLTKLQQPDGSYFTATYDTAHRVTQMADSFGNSINYTLDSAGDPTTTKIENPSAVATKTTSATYDVLRRMSTFKNGSGWQTSYTYDTNGILVSFTPPSQANNYTRDPLLHRLTGNIYPYGNITYTWDAHDRPLTATTSTSAVTSYVYDGFGDVIQETSPDRCTTVYHYDSDGNLTSKTDALSIVTNHTWDALDRMLTTTYPADTSENVAYTYDQTGTGFAFGIGRLTSVTDMAGSLTRTYDERGNLITGQRTSGSTVLTTTYSYDAASRLSTITYPSGAVVTYVRDAIGRVTSVTDKPSGASSATTLASSVTYEPFGPYLSFTYGNGINETVTRDGNYDLLTLKDIGTATVQSLTYTYAVMDLPNSFVDSVSPSTTTVNMGHDGLYRLYSISTYQQGGFSYGYDNNGNRTSSSMPPTSTTYTYTANTNRLATIKVGSVTTTVSTNANGNITGFSPAYGAAGVTGLSYNNANRLTSVSSASSTLGSYVYDGFGNRFSKTVGSATTLFQYMPDMTLLEETTGGTPTDYIYLNGRPIAMLTGTTFTYLHGDKLGTPRAATNASQTLLWRQTTLPYGETLVSTGTPTTNLRFPGQYYDAETGFNHNGFRDYVPQLGRYLESDPTGLAVGLNTYTYVGLRPADLTDPWGLASWNLFKVGSNQWDTENIWNPSGYFSISGHGLGFGIEDENIPSVFGGAELTGDEFLLQLEAHGYVFGSGVPIALHSCGSGSNTQIGIFAQWLATQTNAPVVAASDDVFVGWVFGPNGLSEVNTVANGGQFYVYYPDNRSPTPLGNSF